MSKADMYRRAIENATLKAELSSSDEMKQLWLHIRDQYDYLTVLDVSLKEQSFSELANRIEMEWRRPTRPRPR